MLDVRQIIPEGFCLECDGCCRFTSDNPPWPPHAIRPVPNKKDNNFLCPDLNISDNKCKIYKTRPFECRLYPFLINRDKVSGKIFLSLDLNCPFAQEQPKSKEFEKYTEYLTTFLKSAGFIKALKDNAEFIQSYPGVLNIIELPL